MADNRALRPGIPVLVFLICGALMLFAGWVVLGSWTPRTTLELGMLIAFFVLSPLGSFWMLYDCAVNEKPPVQYYVLALFFPYSFIWYYFSRVRRRQSSSRIR